VRSVLSKGSANMIPDDWITIAQAAKESIDKGVDGIVILHGTDTMQYTAASAKFHDHEPARSDCSNWLDGANGRSRDGWSQ
jgi:L-asparaginase/Glu-tRNA(Gln) amidotransferase subunit D